MRKGFKIFFFFFLFFFYTKTVVLHSNRGEDWVIVSDRNRVVSVLEENIFFQMRIVAHANFFFFSHRTTHSFDIYIMMHSFYK